MRAEDLARRVGVVPRGAHEDLFAGAVQAVGHELVGDGRVVRAAAQAREVAGWSAGDPALRLLHGSARRAVLLQRLRARQAEQIGAQSLETPVRVEPHQQADGGVGFVGERRLDQVAHPVHEHVERLDEQLLFGGEVGVEDRRRDADLPDDVADAGAPVAAASELQRGGLQDGVAGLLRAPRHEVRLSGLTALDERADALADLVEWHPILLEGADLAQSLDVDVAVDRTARRRLLRRRQQTVADVVVDGASRRACEALELADTERPHVADVVSLAGHGRCRSLSRTSPSGVALTLSTTHSTILLHDFESYSCLPGPSRRDTLNSCWGAG